MRSLSATRTYPNLSDADLELIPKTITDGGKTLTLGAVEWSGGENGFYTATATYTGTSSTRSATGYTVTASYTGHTDYTHMIEPRPNEWLLLCRFADTIGIEHGSRELRELRQLAEYLDKSCFEGLNGYVNPVVATEIEKEIILRSTPYYAHGLGHDIAPAVRLLKDYEQNGPVFTQAERNLILTCAYFMGSIRDTEQIAGRMAAHDFSNRDIASACIAIEAVNLEWSGLGQMEGLEMGAAKCPTLQFSFENCEEPMKAYRWRFRQRQNEVFPHPKPDAMHVENLSSFLRSH